MIRIKRIYEKPDRDDGFRVLVDRLWPRGISKETAKLDLWLKEIAPSEETRKKFCHEAARWEDFRKAYLAELGKNTEAVAQLRALCKKGAVTLLFAAKDVKLNNAAVLKDYLGG